MSQLGRISGGLLKDNLERNGINLNFTNVIADVTANTPLLHLDVVNGKIGVKTDAPSDELEVNSTIGSSNLVGNYLNIADISIDTSQIVSNVGNLNLSAAGPRYDVNWTTVAFDILRTSAGLDPALKPFLITQSPIGYLYGDITLTRQSPSEPYYNAFGAEINSSDGLYLLWYRDGNPSLPAASRDFIENYVEPALQELRESDPVTYGYVFNTVYPDPTIVVSSLATDDVLIDTNNIYTRTANRNLELRPNAAGLVEFYNDTNITGSLYATGDITFGGNLTIGDNANDNLVLDGELTSDLIPDQSNTYDLGSPTKKFQNIYTNLVNGERIEVGTITVSDTSLATRQGNIFYVAENGSDTNVGDHQQGPFRTIRHALEVADASSEGPVTIHVFPGEYEETLPLVIPERVTISGEDIRNTIVVPDTASQFEDVFHLNQNCTIENITIKDFYYDSLNDTGYAFSFAPNALITERSPYIRNVTVITQGSITSISDPRGFNEGDAGKGALIDGAVVNNLTPTPSMLFHSATFITPGVDAITMTNGVRVEWLNSFTYFANRGLYATNGTGRIGPDGSTLEYGAEIRSIGSASVYGNYGAEADGADTLMYLIGHNFAYIGTGKDVSNDRTLTLIDQETIELNNGKIYYTSTDADGTFRVGNAFYVDFETGSTSIDVSQIDFSGVSSIFINTGGNITYIDGERIDLGDFRISGNTIETLTQDLNLTPTTGVLDVDTNNVGFIVPLGSTATRTNLQGDLRYNTDTDLFEGYSTANVGFGGIYSDNRNTSVTADGDLIFTANSIQTGSVTSADGGKINLNGLRTDDIFINNNTITSDTSADIVITNNGVGETVIDDLRIYDNVIENTSANNMVFASTGRGALKMNTSGAFVVPASSAVDRPPVAEIGMMRINTDNTTLENFDGVQWINAVGAGGDVTEEDMEDILNLYILVLG